jgi:hypothetical protein
LSTVPLRFINGSSADCGKRIERERSLFIEPEKSINNNEQAVFKTRNPHSAIRIRKAASYLLAPLNSTARQQFPYAVFKFFSDAMSRRRIASPSEILKAWLLKKNLSSSFFAQGFSSRSP